ncbi:MAG: acetylglutamate kinase [Deltaproteobacteria bacterium]
MDQASQIQHAEILLEALPYIRRFAGKTVVVKYGGNAMVDEDLKQAFAQDIVLLKYVGMNPVVVHGGGPQINQLLADLNIESRFVRGMRVTDAATMRVVDMVLAGQINGEIVTNIQRAGGKAVGFSGKDGGLLEGKRLDSEGGDLGHAGQVVSVDPGIIRAMERDGFIPVIAPVGASKEGESLNINADIAAGKIAEALGAEKFLLLTDVAGILDDAKKLIPSLDAVQAQKLIDDGTVEGGMIPKVSCCLEALAGGVRQVHIIDGRQRHAVLLELFTDTGVGTEVHRPGTTPRKLP